MSRSYQERHNLYGCASPGELIRKNPGFPSGYGPQELEYLLIRNVAAPPKGSSDRPDGARGAVSRGGRGAGQVWGQGGGGHVAGQRERRSVSFEHLLDPRGPGQPGGAGAGPAGPEQRPVPAPRTVRDTNTLPLRKEASQPGGTSSLPKRQYPLAQDQRAGAGARGGARGGATGWSRRGGAGRCPGEPQRQPAPVPPPSLDCEDASGRVRRYVGALADPSSALAVRSLEDIDLRAVPDLVPGLECDLDTYRVYTEAVRRLRADKSPGHGSISDNYSSDILVSCESEIGEDLFEDPCEESCPSCPSCPGCRCCPGCPAHCETAGDSGVESTHSMSSSRGHAPTIQVSPLSVVSRSPSPVDARSYSSSFPRRAGGRAPEGRTPGKAGANKHSGNKAGARTGGKHAAKHAANKHAVKNSNKPAAQGDAKNKQLNGASAGDGVDDRGMGGGGLLPPRSFSADSSSRRARGRSAAGTVPRDRDRERERSGAGHKEDDSDRELSPVSWVGRTETGVFLCKAGWMQVSAPEEEDDGRRRRHRASSSAQPGSSARHKSASRSGNSRSQSDSRRQAEQFSVAWMTGRDPRDVLSDSASSTTRLPVPADPRPSGWSSPTIISPPVGFRDHSEPPHANLEELVALDLMKRGLGAPAHNEEVLFRFPTERRAPYGLPHPQHAPQPQPHAPRAQRTDPYDASVSRSCPSLEERNDGGKGRRRQLPKSPVRVQSQAQGGYQDPVPSYTEQMVETHARTSRHQSRRRSPVGASSLPRAYGAQSRSLSRGAPGTGSVAALGGQHARSESSSSEGEPYENHFPRRSMAYGSGGKGQRVRRSHSLQQVQQPQPALQSKSGGKAGKMSTLGHQVSHPLPYELDEAVLEAYQVQDHLRAQNSRRAARSLIEERVRSAHPGLPGPSEYVPQSRAQALAMEQAEQARARSNTLSVVLVPNNRGFPAGYYSDQYFSDHGAPERAQGPGQSAGPGGDPFRRGSGPALPRAAPGLRSYHEDRHATSVYGTAPRKPNNTTNNNSSAPAPSGSHGALSTLYSPWQPTTLSPDLFRPRTAPATPIREAGSSAGTGGSSSRGAGGQSTFSPSSYGQPIPYSQPYSQPSLQPYPHYGHYGYGFSRSTGVLDQPVDNPLREPRRFSRDSVVQHLTQVGSGRGRDIGASAESLFSKMKKSISMGISKAKSVSSEVTHKASRCKDEACTCRPVNQNPQQQSYAKKLATEEPAPNVPAPPHTPGPGPAPELESSTDDLDESTSCGSCSDTCSLCQRESDSKLKIEWEKSPEKRRKPKKSRSKSEDSGIHIRSHRRDAEDAASDVTGAEPIIDGICPKCPPRMSSVSGGEASPQQRPERFQERVFRGSRKEKVIRKATSEPKLAETPSFSCLDLRHPSSVTQSEDEGDDDVGMDMYFGSFSSVDSSEGSGDGDDAQPQREEPPAAPAPPPVAPPVPAAVRPPPAQAPAPPSTRAARVSKSGRRARAPRPPRDPRDDAAALQKMTTHLSGEDLRQWVEEGLRSGRRIMAEAVWDNLGLEPDGLQFRAGDTIQIIRTEENSWWWGVRNPDSGEHDIGHFPVAAVRVRVGQEDCEPQLSDNVEDATNRMRSCVVEELVNTEREFVKTLRNVREGFALPAAANESLFTKVQVRLIFCNLEEILNFQTVFLKDLEQAMDWSAPHNTCFGEIFMKHVDGFRIYVTYCNGHTEANSTLEELTRMEVYKKFFETCRDLRGMQPIPLDGFLLTPVQRICKYPLQLSELIKYTRPSHPDYPRLQEALIAMADMAAHVNESKKRSEGLEKLAVWQRNVHCWEGPDLIDDSSVLVYQGTVTLIYGPGYRKPLRRLFLFDHQLILCKRKRHYFDFDAASAEKSQHHPLFQWGRWWHRTSYEYSGRFNMDTCEVVDVSEHQQLFPRHLRNAIRVNSLLRDTFLLFSLPNKATKNRWLEAFREERDLVENDARQGIRFTELDKNRARLAALRPPKKMQKLKNKESKVGRNDECKKEKKWYQM